MTFGFHIVKKKKKIPHTTTLSTHFILPAKRKIFLLQLILAYHYVKLDDETPLYMPPWCLNQFQIFS